MNGHAHNGNHKPSAPEGGLAFSRSLHQYEDVPANIRNSQSSLIACHDSTSKEDHSSGAGPDDPDYKEDLSYANDRDKGTAATFTSEGETKER